MKIVSRMQRIPGGMMVIPLIMGSVINTFFPNALTIGSFTTATFGKGAALTIIGFVLVCIGTQIKFRETPEVLKRGSVLLIAKYLAGAVIGVAVAKIFGENGFFGLTGLALICTVTNSNGGLYLALMSQYGEPTDIAAQSVLNLNDGPFLTLVTLGAAGLATIPFVALLAAVMPIIVGMVLGNIDDDFGAFFMPAVAPAIPILSFSLGVSINLHDIINAGPSGALLGVIVAIGSGIPLIWADRVINKRPGYAGAALATAAGNAVATPAAVAMIDPRYAEHVSLATAQVAASVIVTAILAPILTAWVVRRYGDAKSFQMKKGTTS